VSILINNGRIIDGQNKPSCKSNVLIDNDKITEISDSKIQQKADIVIDASNKIVSPGFIDVHSHYDFSYLVDNKATYSVMQGITTEIVGNCGLGLAPMNQIVDVYYSKYIKFLLGSLETKAFESIGEFMNHIEQNKCSLNVGFFIPQGNVRAYHMQMDDRYPNEDELSGMKKLVEQGMKDGAFGLSTGLIYPPGSITTTPEIIELCKVISKYNGIYSSHIRDEGKGVLDSIQEAITIGRESGASVQVSHVKVASAFPGKTSQKIIDLLNEARNKGIDINGDIYPYTAGNSVLSALLQPWVFQDDKFDDNITNPETRQRIIDEFKETVWQLAGIPKFLTFIPKSWWLKLIIKIVVKRVIITSMMHQHEFEGKTLKETISTLYPDKDIYNATLDLLKEEEGAIIISMFLMKKKDVKKLMKSPHLMFATDNLAPAVGKCHPRCLGTFPRILGSCVRDQKLLSIEEAIYKMTGFPAQKFKINDRGVIKQDMKADIVIFDPKTITDTATHQDPMSFPKGIHNVIVNGKIVVDEGKHTDLLPGTIVKPF